jgi:hypothetical protein
MPEAFLPRRGENQCASPPGSLLVHVPACAEPILDHPVDPLNRPGIETEGQQLPGALNLDGQGIKTLFQTLPVALNIGFELLALIAHGSPSGSGGSKGAGGSKNTLSSMGAEIGGMTTQKYRHVPYVPGHDKRSHGVLGTGQMRNEVFR